jgi:DNA repair exonuclease SbcCD ATPase subunit
MADWKSEMLRRASLHERGELDMEQLSQQLAERAAEARELAEAIESGLDRDQIAADLPSQLEDEIRERLLRAPAHLNLVGGYLAAIAGQLPPPGNLPADLEHQLRALELAVAELRAIVELARQRAAMASRGWADDTS